MTIPTVARLHEREMRTKRIVLIAKVNAEITAGSYVALVDVRGELFLKVIKHDDPEFLTANQVTERIRQR